MDLYQLNQPSGIPCWTNSLGQDEAAYLVCRYGEECGRTEGFDPVDAGAGSLGFFRIFRRTPTQNPANAFPIIPPGSLAHHGAALAMINVSWSLGDPQCLMVSLSQAEVKRHLYFSRIILHQFGRFSRQSAPLVCAAKCLISLYFNVIQCGAIGSWRWLRGQ
eukprot:s1940_g4.t1